MGNTTYVSKGQRPNVSRKTTNAARSERRANPTLQMILAKLSYRDEIAKRKDKTSKDAFQRILTNESVYYQALSLYDKYKSAYTIVRKNGEDRRSYCTWSACVQAVKTDYVSSFQLKWTPRLVAEDDKSKKNEKK